MSLSDEELLELCHRLMREDESSVMLIRGYGQGMLQLLDKAKEIEPRADREILEERLYMLCLPGCWGAERIGEMMKANPNVTGKEIAEVLRKTTVDYCQHGRSTSGSCIACEELPGLDVSEDSIQDILDEKRKLRAFAESIQDNWDHDEDAHKYGTVCRVCAAEKILKETV